MNIWTTAFHFRHYKDDVKRETVFFATISQEEMLDNIFTDWLSLSLKHSLTHFFVTGQASSQWSFIYIGVIWFTERFNIITCICYTCVRSGIFIHVLVVGTAKFISSLSSVISNRPACLKLAWTVPWVERLSGSFRWRTRNIKYLLPRKRSIAERFTLILRKILERFQTRILDPACKATQDFQSWLSKMQSKRNQMGW